MKKGNILLMSIGLVILMACNKPGDKQVPTANSSDTVYSLDTTSLKSGESFFQCEMHPEIISASAGQCPKCGMELVKKTKQ